MSHSVGYGETPPVPLCLRVYRHEWQMDGIHRTRYPVEVNDHHMQVRSSKTRSLDVHGSGVLLAYGFPGLYRMIMSPVKL
jgi:hypothetical protein